MASRTAVAVARCVVWCDFSTLDATTAARRGVASPPVGTSTSVCRAQLGSSVPCITSNEGHFVPRTCTRLRAALANYLRHVPQPFIPLLDPCPGAANQKVSHQPVQK
eukprot:1813269-Pyramimonas_sp.AAC.1